MKRYLPMVLSVLFVLLTMGVWALMAKHVKGKQEAEALASADSVPSPVVMELWPDGPAELSGINEPEEELGWGLRLVQHATLTVYPAAKPNGQAILVCPGGGYWVVCHKHEGSDMVDWMHERGITLAVLRYRMPNEHDNIPLTDAKRAMHLLREHSAEWGIRQIGVMGFSAGGHLASTLSTHFTCPDERPDFAVLIYPVISMDTAITHMGSRDALIGAHPTDSLTRLYSNELQVTAETPRTFLALSGDDDLVPIANSLRYYEALQRNSVPAVLHMYPSGGHGWGWNDTDFSDLWKERLSHWLKKTARN